MFCSKCGTKSLEDSAFCQKCGARLIVDAPAPVPPTAPPPAPDPVPDPPPPIPTPAPAPVVSVSIAPVPTKVFCQKCGSQALENSAFCQKCGAKLIIEEAAQPMPSEPITTVTPEPVSPPEAVVSTVTAVAPWPVVEPTPQEPKEKKSKKLLFGIAGIAVVAVIAIAIVIISNLGDTPVDFVEAAKSVKPLEKQGISATYGEILGKYITDLKWTQRGESGDLYIDAAGKDDDGSDIKITFELIITNTDARCLLDSAVYDGSPYNAATLMETYFDAYKNGFATMSDYYDSFRGTGTSGNPGSGSTEPNVGAPTGNNEGRNPGSEYPGELLYNGVPISSFFDLTIYDVEEAMGPPSATDGYAGGLQYYYDDMGFWYDAIDGRITVVEIDPRLCEVDGVTLDKNREGLIRILGVPDNEGMNQDEDGDYYGYYMRYNRQGYSFNIEMPSPDENAKWWIMIRPIDSDNGGDPSAGTSSTDNQYPGALLYNGVPVSSFFDLTIYDVTEAMGMGSPLAINRYAEGVQYYYNDMEFWCDAIDGRITVVEIDPRMCEVDGVTLDKNRDELVSILGNPAYEDLVEDDTSGEYYYMRYARQGILFDIEMPEMPSTDVKANWMMIWPDYGV